MTVRCKACPNGWVTLPKARDSAIEKILAAAPPPKPLPPAGPDEGARPVAVTGTAASQPVSPPPPAAAAPSEADEGGYHFPSIRTIGITLVVAGLGAAVLPLLGFQNRLSRAFDDQPLPGLLVAMIGGGLVLFAIWNRD
jgi:hypothetical protein